MDIRRAVAWLRRELNDIERMMASIEDNMAASRARPRNPAAPSKRTREWLAILHAPFPEPEVGLWVHEDH